MDSINELEVRRNLQRGQVGDELTTNLIAHILNESVEWEERRACWHYLLQSGREATLLHALAQCLRAKMRVPFDLIIALMAKAQISPSKTAIEGLLKGARKQQALDELIVPRAWDEFDPRFAQIRQELLEVKMQESQALKGNLLEKFQFLQNQRMIEQAARVLRRMIELYPDEKNFKQLKRSFDEERAREVIAHHEATAANEKFLAPTTTPSPLDEEMLNCFAKEGEMLCARYPNLAVDLAIGFWFMDDYDRALTALTRAQASESRDWLNAELLFASRRYVEALENLRHLEVQHVANPETVFAVAYLRAQCLKALGEDAQALEILQSIVRVRPNYRSSATLLQDWSTGAEWE